MIHWNATGAVANISDPVLVIAGAEDIVTKPEASAAIAGAAVAAQLHVVNDANHMSFLDHASIYHQLIMTFAAEATAKNSRA